MTVETKTVRLQKSTIKLLIETTSINLDPKHGEMIDGRIQELCRMLVLYQHHNFEQIVAILPAYNVTLVIKGEKPKIELPSHLRI
jgi:hypothetical protein